MGTHGFRAPEKEAVNLETQRNPLQIHGFTCKLVVHDQLQVWLSITVKSATLTKSPLSIIDSNTVLSSTSTTKAKNLNRASSKTEKYFKKRGTGDEANPV